MTRAEKLGQLTQYAGDWTPTGPSVKRATEEQVRRGEVGSFLSFFGAGPTRRMQRIAVEESRLRMIIHTLSAPPGLVTIGGSRSFTSGGAVGTGSTADSKTTRPPPSPIST